MRDLLNNSTSKDLVPAVNTGFSMEEANSLSVNGTSVDLEGEGRKCLILISVGATSTATLSVSITSGTDDSTFGTTETTRVLDTTGLTVIDLAPQNRYIRAEYSVSSTGAVTTHTFVSFSVKGIIYNERFRPSNVS